MSTKRAKNNWFVGMLGGVVILGTFVAMIFSPEVTTSERILLIVLILLFGGLITWAFLERHFRKSLGQTMRALASDDGRASVPDEADPESVRLRKAPAHPFKYQMFDASAMPESSQSADGLLARGYQHYRRYVTNLIIGALFLWVSVSFLWAVSSLLNQQAILSLNFLCGSALALLMAFLVANPRRYPTPFTILIWFGLNFLFLVPLVAIMVLNLIPLFTRQLEWASLFVLLSAGAILAMYILLMLGIGSVLRRQVTAQKPMRLLVLWVFNSANNLISTLSGIGLVWQFLGTIQFLRGGGLTVDLGELVKNKRAELVVDTAEELSSRLKTFKHAPNWSGLYPRNTLLCGDRVWKWAVHAFLRDADAVAMSLFGFSKTNQGCVYELGLLFDSFPVDRVLFLVDDTTDLDFLLATLEENWDNMAADSPNQGDRGVSVRIYHLSKRFDQPLSIPGNSPVKDSRRSRQGEHPLFWVVRTFSATQSAIAREADCMLKLILEGVGG